MDKALYDELKKVDAEMMILFRASVARTRDDGYSQPMFRREFRLWQSGLGGT